jgi:hypothetical protein
MGEVAVTGRLVAVGRELIAVGRALVLVRARLIAVRTCVVSVGSGLIQTRARPIVFACWLVGDHQIPFPAHATGRSDQSARKLEGMHQPDSPTSTPHSPPTARAPLA